MGELISKIKIQDIIDSYETKKEDIKNNRDFIAEAISKLESSCCTMGAYGGSAFDGHLKSVSELHKILRISTWRYIYNELNIKHIAPKTHLKKINNTIDNPPEFNWENLKMVFGEYVMNPRHMALKAFAEIFCNLDPFYKSHDNFKVGVKGLPKRIIISGCGTRYAYGYERVADTVNVIARYKGRIDLCISTHDAEKVVKGGVYLGMQFKHFKNGNVHIIFSDEILEIINKCLAEYYGEVLPDAYEHTEKKAESKEVSKDLQYYRTPDKLADDILGDIYIGEDYQILEPSCGDGSLLRAIKIRRQQLARIHDWQCPAYFKTIGVEVDAERCEHCRQQGFSVYNDNFLTWQTDYKFDLIVMNPPFYGTHYRKHIAKAFEILKDDGEIHAILPVTAMLNDYIESKYRHVTFKSLPMGSFAESGTNVNTCIVKITKRSW